MEHFGYLFAAYSIIFGVIFLYVMFIWRRQTALDAELRALEAQMASLKGAHAQNDTRSAQSDK